MDCNYYKCEKCGFTYQEPSYWSDFSAEDEMEMPHINLTSKETCEEIILKLIKK